MPEDFDTLEEEESVNSLTNHGAIYILSVLRAKLIIDLVKAIIKRNI